jgi:hypothetical protein
MRSENQPAASLGPKPDAVEEAGLESFPASDPPAWGRAARWQEKNLATSFTCDIRPLFRVVDVACMSPRGVKLDDVDWMCRPAAINGFDDHGNARGVFVMLSRGSMPPDERWTRTQLDLFERWMTEGFAI